MFERDENIFSMLFPYLIGALIGAGIALLMAPKSGQETRHMIRERGVELKDRAAETVGDTTSRASQAIDDLKSQAKEGISAVKHRGQEMVDERSARMGA
jgi:gas vesicle protein